jgi:hypothetical protein
MLHLVRDLRHFQERRPGDTQFYHETAYLAANPEKALVLTYLTLLELDKSPTAEAASFGITERIRVCLVDRVDLPPGGAAVGAGNTALAALEDLRLGYANSVCVKAA